MNKWIFTLVIFYLYAGSAIAEKIWISTDLHISTGGGKQMMAFDTLVKIPEAGDVMVFMGDLANSGHSEEHRQVKERLGCFTEGVKVFVVPGNHDLTMEMPPDMFRKVYRKYGYDQAFSLDPGSLSYAVMPFEGMCFLMLDTNAWDSDRQMVIHSQLDADVIRWVSSVIKEIPEGTNVLVFGHHPLFPFEGNDTTEGAEQASQVLSDGKVLAYLCGHRHANGTQLTKGLRQIMVGVPWSYPAYLGLIEETGDRLEYMVKPLFDYENEIYRNMKEESIWLAERMAEGSLEGTSYEGDTEAIDWFIRFFIASLDGALVNKAGALQSEAGYEHWQQAEVRSAVKPWIITTMKDPLEDYHRIRLEQKGSH